MPDEMVAGSNLCAEEIRIQLEIDALDRQARRKAAALDENELEALGQRALRAPGRAGADDAPVNEDEPFHGMILAM